MHLTELTGYLDEYLRVQETPDYANAYNGLQVQTTRDVRRVGLAVDACLHTIREAARSECEVMFVHHGLFWGVHTPVVGLYYERLAHLIRSNMGIYACHLPLDAHEEVGNNHVLCRSLGLEPSGMFADFKGVRIGVWADADTTAATLSAAIEVLLGVRPRVLPTGPAAVRRVGIVSGGAGDCIAQALEVGCDTLVTGEGEHHTYFDAEELGVNVLHCGHYATETVGVKALGAHLESQLGLETVFIDHPTGL